jgi:Domain of Unknown Function (DUF1259)
MKPARRCAISLLGLFVFSLAAVPLPAKEPPKDYEEVLAFLGRTGEFRAKVLKVNIPRHDLLVTILEQPAPTPFGFGGWVAMTKGDGGMEVLMGDLVLAQFEVDPVLSAFLGLGIEVTALHNHFLFEEPRLYNMHIHGLGETMNLARAIKPALDLIGNVPPVVPSLRTTPPVASVSASPFDMAALNKIFGFDGEKLGAVYKFTAGRDDLHLTEMGAAINARMGLNPWASFAGTDADAQIAGDIAMRESEVNAVLKALRAHDLTITAIHHHMLGTQPSAIFLHYWGRGPSAKLAAGFRAALRVLGK